MAGGGGQKIFLSVKFGALKSVDRFSLHAFVLEIVFDSITFVWRKDLAKKDVIFSENDQIFFLNFWHLRLVSN